MAQSPASQDDADRRGSTGVPMDSFVYPALERLGALGLVPDQNLAIRPWTRKECRRQLAEVTSLLEQRVAAEHDQDAVEEAAADLLPGLRRELEEPASSGAILESVYTRAGVIAGPALTDGFHFGQTWHDDFGRPGGRGSTILTGYALRLTARRFFVYNRQEVQSSPGTPAITPALHSLFHEMDDVHYGSPGPDVYPVAPSVAASIRARPLELYAGVAFGGNALSFGKQALFWGPGTSPLAFSSNAEPPYSLRLLATRPHPFPFVPRCGSYRFDFVFGKLSGHRYPARPYFNGQKISFNFGKTLEISFTRWSLLFGVGHPMTLHALKDNFFSSSSTGTTFAYGERTDPGDRKSGFDFRLRVPGTRGLLTLYADSYADDEVNPIDAPRRVIWAPGLYLARLPRLPHVDLRLEAPSSQELSRDEGGLRAFINNQYRDANTNRGFLLGNPVGRDGRSLEARLGYWRTATTRLELGLRQTKQSPLYLPGGGTISDAFVTGSLALSPAWTLGVFSQYERFLIPAYLPGSQQNASLRVQIQWDANRVLRTH